MPKHDDRYFRLDQLPEEQRKIFDAIPVISLRDVLWSPLAIMTPMRGADPEKDVVAAEREDAMDEMLWAEDKKHS